MGIPSLVVGHHIHLERIKPGDTIFMGGLERLHVSLHVHVREVKGPMLYGDVLGEGWCLVYDKRLRVGWANHRRPNPACGQFQVDVVGHGAPPRKIASNPNQALLYVEAMLLKQGESCYGK